MTSIYENLICDLKIKLKNKNKNKKIKCKDLFSLINDETIQTLIVNIVAERKRIGNNMENKLNNLLWLNDLLIKFGEKPQSSKTKALKLLKTKVFINIYDLEAEKYEKRTTKQKLEKELREKCDRRFPLGDAKEYITLRSFLIKV